jgi:hypothetical protein
MPRYKLDIEEKTTRNHTVIIETDKSIDAICDYIERSNNGIADPYDIRYIAGVNLVGVEEGAEGLPEFEVLDVDEIEGSEHNA